MQYAYIVGCLMLGVVWLSFFVARNDLRKEMIFGSILGLPFGFTEFLFVPEYWNPPSLFNLIQKIGFGIESLLFGFLVAGICSVAYEVFEKKRIVKIRAGYKYHFSPYIYVTILYLLLEFILPLKTIYNLIFPLLTGAALMSYKRRDLFSQITISGFIFAGLYFLLFLFFNKLFPQFISEIYNLKFFWGINIFGVPIEEILFAFAVGSCWSTFYEFIKGYKLAGKQS